MKSISLKTNTKSKEVLSYFNCKDRTLVNLPLSKNLHKKMFNETEHIIKIGLWKIK